MPDQTVSADGERQRDHRDRGEPRSADELADAESHVLYERLHLGPLFSMGQAGYVATGPAAEE
jgi:hypothetical protein